MNDNNKPSTYTVTFDLPRGDYDCIIEMASHGIAYWASRMYSEDNGCHFTEAGTGKKFFITPKDVEKAVLDLHITAPLNDYYQSAIRGLVVDGCAGDVGSDIADAIVQQACFGKVVYG